jgi:glutathione synthase/RimK-type ligase-like ATP-grasp enzyme
MKKYDVALLTDSRYENPTDPDWYEQQILTEDGFVISALERKGLKVRRVDWASPDFDWTSTRLAVFRTTWDYFFRISEFRAWLDRAAAQTRLLNSHDLVRWNLDKHYLKDLERSNVRIVPTQTVEQGEACDLGAFFEKFDTPELIIKPCVAGAARHTYRVRPDNLTEHQVILDQLLTEEAMLVQPFLRSIPEQGEVSLIVIGDEVRHAVLKIAKPGDFRVQDDFGGTAHAHEATPAERDLALRAVAACAEKTAYARVDIVTDNEGQPALSELELIEPELFFRFNPAAAGLLAEEIERGLAVGG